MRALLPWLGLLGIALEIWGAWLLVAGAKKARERVEALGVAPAGVTYDQLGQAATLPLEQLRQQHADQLRGFAFLGLGLLGQFAAALRDVL